MCYETGDTVKDFYDVCQNIWSMAVSPCNEYLYVGGGSGELIKFSLRDFEVVKEVKISQRLLSSMVVGKEGEFLFIGDHGGALYKWCMRDDCVVEEHQLGFEMIK